MDILQFPNPANKNTVTEAKLEPAPTLLINHDLVADLQAMLLWAKTGEMTSLVWTGISHTGQSLNGWQTLIFDHEPQLLGQLDLLHSEFKRAISE